MREEQALQRAAPTIYDVAQRAGVSISTVSLALNSPSRVRPETLSRVHSAVRDLGFVPKAEAAVRARKGTRRIGVVGRFSAISSELERLQGLLAAAAEDNYEVAVYEQQSAAFHLHLVDSLSLARKVDGLILVDIAISDRLVRRLEEDNVPTVLIEYARPDVPSVSIDNLEGGRIVGRYLAERGHHRCAFLGLVAEPAPPPGYPTIDEQRLQGFREGLAGAGYGLPDRYVHREPLSPSRPDTANDILQTAARRGAHALLDMDAPPSAIFATFDLVAAVVLSVARERGLRVPEDLAVIGFDDCTFAAFIGLTTVRQHLSESGRVAFQLLHDHLGSTASTIVKNVTLPLTLVPRSTA